MPKKTYNTAGKRLVNDFLSKNADRQYTVDELYEALIVEGATVGKSSLYRLLESLSGEGLVRKFKTEGDTFTAFQYTGDRKDCERHLHLKCSECGRLVHLECKKSVSLIEHVYKEHGFSIDNKSSVLYGTCNNCKKSKNHGDQNA